MIKVSPKPMSEELRTKYEKVVVAPGKKWLAEHADKTENLRPKPYWNKIQHDVADTFHDRCAYTAIRLNFTGQVDHFVSISEDRSKAYDWKNFRYCAGWFNSKKRNTPSTELLDPLIVEDDWFELTIPDLQLRFTEHCPEELRAKAELMLEKLGLRNTENLMRVRARAWNLFLEQGPSVLPQLDEEAPLVARAARKHLATNEQQRSTDSA